MPVTGRAASFELVEFKWSLEAATNFYGLLGTTTLTSAIDACLNQGAEPEEVAAFQSALSLYLSQLPSPDGDPVRDRLLSLCDEYGIGTP